MREEKVINLIKKIIKLLKKAAKKCDEMSETSVYVCLDCRKITTCPDEIFECWNNDHTYLFWSEYEGGDEISATLDVLEWILEQSGGDENGEPEGSKR